MSDLLDKSATTKLGAHEVAAWLRRHPRFLQQFPDLAVTMVVPRDEGPAASLASYQLEILRDKNRELSRRLHELFANAQDNERLAVRTHQLTLALLRQETAADTLRAMVAVLAEDFEGDVVRIVLFEPVAGMAEGDWLQVQSRAGAAMAPFRDCLAAAEPLCGRLQPEKNRLLYGDRIEEIQSSALLPLVDPSAPRLADDAAAQAVGLLAVGSRDPNRFYPGMGTLFLRMMAEALAVALRRFDA